jgi:hypothetical protein
MHVYAQAGGGRPQFNPNSNHFLSLLPAADALPIARVIGGTDDGKAIFLRFGDREMPEERLYTPTSAIMTSFEPLIHKMKPGITKAKCSDMNIRLNNYLREHSAVEPPLDLQPLVDEIRKNPKYQKTYDAGSGCLQMLPHPKDRRVVYAFGASGSGKTTWIADYVREWRAIFPTNKIYLFSQVPRVPVLEVLGVERISLDTIITADEVTYEAFERGSMVIFDDVDAILDNETRKAVWFSMQQIMRLGRHHNLYCCITMHKGASDRKTSEILSEASGFVVFPGGISKRELRYVLQNYSDVTYEQVMASESRWVFIRNEYPKGIIFHKGCVFSLM